MSILGQIQGAVTNELLEIIEWLDETRDTISYRFPDKDRAIKRGAQLVVRESQAAQFVYGGQFGDVFLPGLHTLTTDNIPVLTTLKGWKYGFESPFKADVYFVTTRLFTGQKWGTSNPILMRDDDLGVVRVRAFGTYDFRIIDPAKFLREVVGTDGLFSVSAFVDTMRPWMVGAFTNALAAARVPVLDVATRYLELGSALRPVIDASFQERYGLSLASLILENVSVPSAVEQAIDKRSGMAAVGNLNEYVKYQLANGLAQPGGGGMARLGAEVAIGLEMAKSLTQPVPGDDARQAALAKLTPEERKALGL